MNSQYQGIWLLLYDWQTLGAGVLAVIAAVGTIWATIHAANREIEATNQQISTANKQIDITLRLDRQRVAYENHAFLTALKSAAGAVIGNIEECRKMIPTPRSQDSLLFYQARQRLQCALFKDLRSACIRFGSDLTDIFLYLDQDIITFSADWVPATSTMGGGYRSGAATGFHEGLERIERKSRALQAEVEKRLEKCIAEINNLAA
jgi:hypothetical protein